MTGPKTDTPPPSVEVVRVETHSPAPLPDASPSRNLAQRFVEGRGRDLAEMSDHEFEQGLAAVKRVQARMKKILDECLTLDVHYGREKDSKGRPVFKKPILKKAGAEEIRRILKWTVNDLAPPEIQFKDGHLFAIIHVGCFDGVGRQVASAQGACHSAEPRFKKYGEKGSWIYEDPREQLHSIVVMARKRASVAATMEASGATAFFADREAIEGAIEPDDDKPIIGWTDQERSAVFQAALARGMGRKDIEGLTVDLFARLTVGTGEEAKRLLDAVNQWEKKKPDPPRPEAEVVRPGDDKSEDFKAYADIPDALKVDDKDDDLPF